MNGTIQFESTSALAEFLIHFTGSTALFKVVPIGNGWLLTFTGGF
jgi:hypothetical protein